MTSRSRRPSPARALYAAIVMVALVAALLIAWFVSGWHDVRAGQRDLRAAPGLAADARRGELVRELRAQLAGVIAAEGDRPYFHYQNLFHDPKASTAWSVAPSPLASGPSDPLIEGYFELDGHGHVTTPTVNDELPELSEPTKLAMHRAFRDEVTRSLSGALAPRRNPVPQVASADLRTQPSHPVQGGPPAQVIQIDPGSYAQNNVGNAGYYRNPNANQSPTPKTSPNPTSNPTPNPTPNPSPMPITITVFAFHWYTLTFAGAPSLIATRQVETPDGLRVQGFVIDRATVTSWLAAHAGDMVAELGPSASSDAGASEIAPHWQLRVSPNPRAMTRAAADATALARDFVLQFVAIGILAALAAAFVVMLVARAERLAHERSQFAAAAAHELRTPLAGLQLYGDMLADELGDPTKQRDYARRMSEEAARLGRVVSNVLGFSQLERGNLSVDAHDDDLEALLHELAERARPALVRAGVTLEVDAPAGLRARIDRDAVARIVGNLLDNAEKYSRGSADRTIRLAAAEREGAIEVLVSDHGPGVAAKTPLFQPFARGVSGDGPAGLGLGLALSRSLARAMGGDLVHRATADGAMFVLELRPSP